MYQHVKINMIAGLLLSLMLAPVGSAFAGPLFEIDGEKAFQNYVHSVVESVKKEKDPEEKRALLNESFLDMMAAIDRISALKTGSDTEKEGLAELRKMIEEKHNELNGLNGYDPVPASQLDRFADYVQQDLEQADRVLTISLTTLLLIVIIIILIA
jgi:hypothetical protein